MDRVGSVDMRVSEGLQMVNICGGLSDGNHAILPQLLKRIARGRKKHSFIDVLNNHTIVRLGNNRCQRKNR
jgi:hypothetical protein